MVGSLSEKLPELDPFLISNDKQFKDDKMTQTKHSSTLSSPQSTLRNFDEEEEKLLHYPLSNQQTLDFEWYQELINKKRRWMETKIAISPRTAPSD